MKVLIIENEVYLAQSIATKLGDLGYDCEIARNIKDDFRDEFFNVVLLSTSFNSEDIYKIINKFKNSIIMLLITYISNDTVTNPIKAGATDYIQKPFMIEELVRKIKHFEDFKRYQGVIKTYQDYLNYHFKSVTHIEFDFKRLKLPILIKCNKMLNADNFVFEYSKATHTWFKFIPLDPNCDYEKIVKENPRGLLYFSNFQTLRSDDKHTIYNLSNKRKVIIATTNLNEDSPLDVLNITSDEKNFQIDEILTIDEYIKHIIINYQENYPDTELSKKLGISRKSLWEKRKKYDVIKKK
ncbi:MAG: hypothetical protein ACTTJC_05105 [Campylobacter sp.]